MRQKPSGLCKDERGFTLGEVLITIVIMGIVFAIASSTWQSVVQGRAVDSANNQLASDMRLAHIRATNQLTDWAIVSDPTSVGAAAGMVPAGSWDYYLVRIPQSPEVISFSDIMGRYLPDEGAEVEIASSTPLALRFNSDGSAETVSGGVTTIRVHKRDAAYDSNPRHDIGLNLATSRVQIDSPTP